ncbi:MAG: hypothetical protein PVJ80_13945 [Gemmatimonadota bacterium]|jgi:hypothetical protein
MDPGAIIALVSIALGGLLGLGGLLLGAYKVRLDAERERAELAAGKTDAQTLARLEELEQQVVRLAERADFTEKLLGSGD